MSKQENNKLKISPEQLQQLLAGAGSKIAKKPKGFLNIIVYYMNDFIKHLDRLINFITQKKDNDRNEVVQVARSPILFGMYVIFFFVILGGIWAALAPLDSAAVAIGTVISNTNKKILNHPEGGIIKEIYAKQGDAVKTGDKIIEFDDVKIKAQYESSLNNYRTYLAMEARLIAERDNLDSIEFSDFLLKDQALNEVAKIIHTQENLFRSKKELIRTEQASLKQRIAQIRKQIEGYESKKISSIKHLEYLNDRLKAIRTLAAKGFVQKAALSEAESKLALAQSEVAIIDTEIARSEQDITKSEIDLINSSTQYTTKVLTELRETQGQLAQAREQFYAYKDSLNRIILRSPVDGIVNVMHYHTVGSVVSHAQPVAEIIPTNDVLIIEAKVPSKSIDSVHVGLIAKIRFSAFKSRITPLFTGKVVSVSPDIVIDRNAPANPNETYYIARIEIDMDEFNKLAAKRKLELHPGMTAEVQIITGTRTLLRYILDPITDTMFRAFKEK